MKAKVVTFRELVQAKYLDVGFSYARARYTISDQSGVCRHSVHAAFTGTRVAIDTAEDLATWAEKHHRALIDVLAMQRAPCAPTRRRSALRRVQWVSVKTYESDGRREFVVSGIAADNDVTASDVHAALESRARRRVEAG